MHAWNRRDFLKTSAAATAGLLTGHERASADDLRKGYIDAHVHVWTPDTKKYPLAEGFTVDSMKPPSFMPDELFAYCKPSGVTRIVLIQMSFYRYDNSYMLDVMKAHPGVFSGVGIVDETAPDVTLKMKELAKQGVRGFRIHPGKTNVEAWIGSPGMQEMWKCAGDEGLAICPLINPSALPAIDAMCAKFQDVKVVVDHFARVGMSGTIIPAEVDALVRLARFPKTHVKTSAFYALGKKEPPYEDLGPLIRLMMDAYGPGRLMWASDCPFQVQGKNTYGASIDLIRDRLDFISSSDKEQMLRGTAERVFFA